jgi:apolipoprotein N-acyltransferase
MTSPSRSSGLPGFLRGDIITPGYLWVTGCKGWKAHVLAAGLGVFANLAFPPIWFWPALAIALSGLIWLIDGAKLQQKPGLAVFLRVFFFAFGLFVVGLHWVAAAFLVNPGAHLAFIWMAVLLLPGGLALIWAAIMRVAFYMWFPGPARLIVFVVFLSLAEWVRGHLFGGFPWNLPGMVWEPGGAISQTVSIWGVYGLSALTIFAMAAPGALADARPRGATATRAGPAAAAAVVFGALWGWGAHRLDTIPKDPTPGQMVRLISAGVPQSDKYQNGQGRHILQRYLDLSGLDDGKSPPIIIWPEGALPFAPFEADGAIDLIIDRIGNRRLIFGLVRYGEQDKAYNSLAVMNGMSPVPQKDGTYDKAMLVPFGEFTPLRELAAKVGIPTLQELAKDGFFPGEEPGATLKTAGVPPFGALICYEAIFPGLARAGADRPRWLVNISNDSWFGSLSGPYQHAAQARFRAIEEGVPMARVAAGGFTGVIDAYGRWSARANPADPTVWGQDPKGWTSAILDAEIPPVAEPTPYSSWRQGLFWLMVLGFNLGLIVLPRR